MEHLETLDWKQVQSINTYILKPKRASSLILMIEFSRIFKDDSKPQSVLSVLKSPKLKKKTKPKPKTLTNQPTKHNPFTPANEMSTKN